MAAPVAQRAREITWLVGRLNRGGLTDDQLTKLMEMILAIPGVYFVHYNEDQGLSVECSESARLPAALGHTCASIRRRSASGEVRTVKGRSRREDLPTVWDRLLQGVV